MNTFEISIDRENIMLGLKLLDQQDTLRNVNSRYFIVR